MKAKQAGLNSKVSFPPYPAMVHAGRPISRIPIKLDPVITANHAESLLVTTLALQIYVKTTPNC